MSIKYKLLLLLVLCAVLPLTVHVLVTYQAINDRLRSELIAQYKSQSEKLKQSFELSIRNVDNSILSIYQTAELYNFVTDSRQSDADALAMRRRIENLLKILAHSLNDFSNVYLYLNEGHQMFTVNAKYLNVQHSWLDDPDSYGWIGQAQAGEGELVIVYDRPEARDAERAPLFFGRAIPDVITKRQSGVIGIDMSDAYFAAMLGGDNVLEHVDIVGASGQTMYSVQLGPDNGGAKLIVESGVNAYGWKVVSYLSENTLKLMAWEAVRPTVVWGIGFLAAAVLLGALLSRQIAVPMNQLIRRMREVGKGDLNADAWRTEVVRRDEFGFLERQFRSMVVKIDEMIKHEYQLKTSESVARMKALQAQINPHFLYNTLTSIYSEALEAGADNVCRMVKSLSDMFRYTTDFQREQVTVGAEIEHVRNYLAIQKFRFEDKLSYRIEIPSHVIDKPMLKLSLQPIVENAVVHGIAKTGHGMLLITGTFADGDVVISVEDTAGRLDEAEAARLTRIIRGAGTSLSGGSVGLANVHQRIQHLFQGSEGVSLEAERGRTIVNISWKTG